MMNLIYGAISILLYLNTSVYSFSINSVDGTPINFNDFQGKKILIVNIATSGSDTSQLGALQQLYQQYSDSLMIIAFPSNSFGNEPRSNSEIKQFCSSLFGVTFPIAAKGAVKDVDIQVIYQWLTQQSQNGVSNNTINKDYQKYLIDKNGQLMGVFSGDVLPNHPGIIQGITGN